ncbi:hypothetical protein BCR36DRAFT_346175 [Piromyces finnis]|uniref:PB1 domain-containing protein n=1 Tax=Piromyces finnis TaxID=1754191 RepID=A0A1Y1VGL0_9FUNG|nr:hypothetical protein BCR36DRAFT_346175 [Piromyces finnis]|eukprot:ORX55867.1 hypothetical protein BCR36DRAFT_346175 [Piromyces finnis]
MNGSEIQIKAQLKWHIKNFKLPLSGLGDYETLKIIIKNIFNLDDNVLFMIEYNYSNEFYFISSQEDLWKAIDRTLGQGLSLYITEYGTSSDNQNNTNVQSQSQSQSVEKKNIPNNIKPSEYANTEPENKKIMPSQPPVDTLEKKESKNMVKEGMPTNEINSENYDNIASTSKGKSAQTTENPSSAAFHKSETSQRFTVNQSSQTDNSEFTNMTIRDIVKHSINLQTDAYRKIIENIKNQTREDTDIVQNITNIIANEYPNEINQIKESVKNNIDHHNEEYKKVVESLRNQTKNNVDMVQNIIRIIGNECNNQYPDEIRKIKENIKNTTDSINNDFNETINKISNIINQYSAYKNIFLNDILNQLDSRNQGNSTSSTETNSTSNTINDPPFNQPNTNETIEGVKNFINNMVLEVKSGIDDLLNYIDEKDEEITNFILGNEYDYDTNDMNNTTNNLSNNEKVTTNNTNGFQNPLSNDSLNDIPVSSNPTNNGSTKHANSFVQAQASSNSTNNGSPKITNPFIETQTSSHNINRSSSIPPDPFNSVRNIFNNITTGIKTGVNNFLDSLDEKDEKITNFILGSFNESDRTNSHDNNNDDISTTTDTTTTSTEVSIDSYEKPIIKSRNNTEHSNNYYIEQFNKYKEDFAKKKLEKIKSKEILGNKSNTSDKSVEVIELSKINKAVEPNKEVELKEIVEPDKVIELKGVVKPNKVTGESNKVAETNEIVKSIKVVELDEVVKSKETIKPNETMESNIPAKSNNLVNSVNNIEIHEIQSEQQENIKESNKEQPSPLSPSRVIFNSVKNSLLSSITSFADSSRFVADEFLGVPIEHTSEITEDTKNTTTAAAATTTTINENITSLNDNPIKKEPVIKMKEATFSEYEKTTNLINNEKEESAMKTSEANDISSVTKEVEEFSNGIINYKDIDDVEKQQHPDIVRSPIKSQIPTNKIIDEDMSSLISEDSFDYHSYSPISVEDDSNNNINRNDINDDDETNEELELLRTQMADESDIFNRDDHKKDLNENNNNNVVDFVENENEPDNSHELNYYIEKGKQIFEEEYKNKKTNEKDEFSDIEIIQIEEVTDKDESTYDSKVQGRHTSSKKGKDNIQQQFDTFEFDIYDDSELEKQIKQKKEEADLLDEYEII